MLKDVGQALADGLGDTLTNAFPLRAPILIAHDTWTQYQLPGRENAAQAASTDSGALFGLFRAAGGLPDLGFIDQMDAATLARYRLVVWRHPGYIGQETLARLRGYVSGGGALVVIGDAQNEVDVQASGAGQVVRLANDPAAGWNGDDFPRLGATAVASLGLAKDLLFKAKIAPLVTVTAAGKEPFVHAWLQSVEGDQRTLLYAENFTRDALSATVTINAAALPDTVGERVSLTPRFKGGRGAASSIVVSKAILTTSGVELPVSADGVDLWDIVPAP